MLTFALKFTRQNKHTVYFVPLFLFKSGTNTLWNNQMSKFTVSKSLDFNYFVMFAMLSTVSYLNVILYSKTVLVAVLVLLFVGLWINKWNGTSCVLFKTGAQLYHFFSQYIRLKIKLYALIIRNNINYT